VTELSKFWKVAYKNKGDEEPTILSICFMSASLMAKSIKEKEDADKRKDRGVINLHARL
jgi:hypothetical protein